MFLADAPFTLDQLRIRLAAAKKAHEAAVTGDEKAKAEQQLQRARHALQAALRQAQDDIMAEPGERE